MMWLSMDDEGKKDLGRSGLGGRWVRMIRGEFCRILCILFDYLQVFDNYVVIMLWLFDIDVELTSY